MCDLSRPLTFLLFHVGQVGVSINKLCVLLKVVWQKTQSDAHKLEALRDSKSSQKVYWHVRT